ncbi:MAG: sulfite exporter TauE/SafE family protein [Paracoccaceae bacterium]
MIELNLTFFAIAAPAVMFAGISKGGFGSGAAFVSASILAIVLEPGTALALMLPLLMLVDLASLKPYWGRWNWQASKLLILAGLPGVVLGAALYKIVDDDAMRILIGAISVGFVGWQVLQQMRPSTVTPTPFGPVAGAIAGVFAGFGSFVSHAGGPPAAIYLLSRRISKTEYQASTVLIFWIINIAKFVPYAWLGLFTLNTFTAGLLLAPFALVGTWVGVRLHHMVPEWLFFLVTYVLLTATGSKLIWDGST